MGNQKLSHVVFLDNRPAALLLTFQKPAPASLNAHRYTSKWPVLNTLISGSNPRRK